MKFTNGFCRFLLRQIETRGEALSSKPDANVSLTWLPASRQPGRRAQRRIRVSFLLSRCLPCAVCLCYFSPVFCKQFTRLPLRQHEHMTRITTTGNDHLCRSQQTPLPERQKPPSSPKRGRCTARVTPYPAPLGCSITSLPLGLTTSLSGRRALGAAVLKAEQSATDSPKTIKIGRAHV